MRLLLHPGSWRGSADAELVLLAVERMGTVTKQVRVDGYILPPL